MTELGIRPAARGDLERVARLLDEYDVADAGRADFGVAVLRDDWDRGGFDPARDAWVAEEAGRLVGYAEVFEEDPGALDAYARVHPDARGRGLGAALVAHTERRAAQTASERGAGLPLRNCISATDDAARALLRAHGYTRVRSFLHMEVALPAPRVAAPVDPSVTIRALDPVADAAAANALLGEAFAGQWGFEATPPDAWSHPIAHADPGLVAIVDGRVAGVLLGRSWNDVGWVEDVGVAAAARRRGVGLALMLEAFEHFARRGLDRAMLNVDEDNPTGAPRLYERVGMQVGRRWDVLEKRIGRPAGGDDRF